MSVYTTAISEIRTLIFYLFENLQKNLQAQMLVVSSSVETMNTKEKQHEGTIIKKAIKQIGIPYATIAKRMCISTSTLYRRFKAEKLNDFFILKLEYALKDYDFSIDFPRLAKTRETLDQLQEVELAHYRSKYLGTFKTIEKRYTDLLKTHKKVLLFLIELKGQLLPSSASCSDVSQLVKEISAEL